MFSVLLMSYLQSVLFFYVLFVAFNAIFNGVGLNMNALRLGPIETKLVLIVPAVQIILSMIFGGVLGQILGMVAFVVIYAKLTGRI